MQTSLKRAQEVTIETGLNWASAMVFEHHTFDDEQALAYHQTKPQKCPANDC
jgi:hypothetical protein